MSTTFTRSIDAATITPALVLGSFESEDPVQTLVHVIPGRETPDVTLRPAQASTGVMRLFFLSHAQADAARVFHRAAAVFGTGSDMEWLPAAYVPQRGIRRAQQDHAGRWVIEIPYQEIPL